MVEAVRMFEGNAECNMCGKRLEAKEKNFGISMKGCTHVFCDGCFASRKKEIKALLQED